MAPSPIPAPLPPWARAIVWLTPMVGGYLYDLVTHANDAPTDLEWRKLMIRFKVTGTGAVTQDDAFIGFDLVNITGGNVDTSWTTGDYSTAEGLFDTWLAGVKAYVNSYATVTEMKWYKREFNPLTITKPFADSGPPQRLTTRALACTGNSHGAPQVSMTITERTAWPKHWGRIYIPFASTAIATNMRFTTPSIDVVANATNTLYNALSTAELFPVIPVTQVDRTPARGLITISQIQVDDVPDVIRRRRPRNTVYRKTLP